MIWVDFHNISSIELFFGGLIVKICFVKYRELILAYFTFCPYMGLLTVSYVGLKNKKNTACSVVPQGEQAFDPALANQAHC